MSEFNKNTQRGLGKGISRKTNIKKLTQKGRKVKSGKPFAAINGRRFNQEFTCNLTGDLASVFPDFIKKGGVSTLNNRSGKLHLYARRLRNAGFRVRCRHFTVNGKRYQQYWILDHIKSYVGVTA